MGTVTSTLAFARVGFAGRRLSPSKRERGVISEKNKHLKQKKGNEGATSDEDDVG